VTHVVVVAINFDGETTRDEWDIDECSNIWETQVLLLDSAIVIYVFIVNK